MRRKIALILGGLGIALAVGGAPLAESSRGVPLALIPLPAKVERGGNALVLKTGTIMVVPGKTDGAWAAAAKVFGDKVNARFGVSLTILALGEANEICGPGQAPAGLDGGRECVPCAGGIMVADAIKACRLEGEVPPDPVPWEEGYKLTVGQSALISAETAHGFHNALMTLLQLVDAKSSPPSLPGVKIVDSPRFRWRGMLLDPARHFLPPEVIKKYIDLLSELKLDVLHWHLVDDQGWRIESKRFPRLHEVGGRSGYYTQEQLKEIVAYAAARQVMIVPEIDIPGHSSAMLAAYPNLSCSGRPVELREKPGIYLTALCPGKEEVYEFLDGLFAEIAELFPSPYVHIGSDEVLAGDWLDYPPNQKLMAERGFTNKAGLQSYFVGRVNEILRKRGKTMIAWDEVTSYLPEGAVVQAWRDQDLARVAAEAGHDAIISPTTHCYIDYPQLLYTLKGLYEFEPLPAGLDPKLVSHILGGEVNLWGERVKPGNIDRKAFPRVIAHAEVMWSPAATRNWEDFLTRLRPIKKDLKKRGVGFGKTWRDLFLLP